MKSYIYGIASVLAISTSLPAMANSAPAMQPAPAMEREATAGTTTETTTRTIIVRETPIYGQQIVKMLEGTDKASSFRNLVAANGLSASLRENGKGYTAFVPVNRAFEKAGVSAPSARSSDGTINAQMRAVLEDHIVDSKFDVNLLHGSRDNVTTLSGKPITISKAGRSYYANGHLIVDRAHTPEGIVYFIESLISSPEINAAIYNPADATK